MSRRRVALVAGLTLLFVLATTNAFAEFRGTDVWSNITPGDGGDGLADRYPLSRYQLDYHVDVGITSPEGIVPSLMQFFSSWAFFFATMAMRFVVYVFDWAFNADLLTGDGLLTPLASVVQSNYREVVLPFLVPAVVFLGAWVAYKAVKRDRNDVGAVLGRTLLFFVVSFAVAFHPTETIGRAYSWVDEMSKAVVSRGGSAQNVSDSLFETFVYRPWAVLQFGGTEVCTGAKTDDDGFPLAATDSNPAKTCHSVFKKDRDGHGDYARRFLELDYDTDERKAEYDALREGEAPDDPQFADTKIDKTDAPAVDLMQAGGSLQRLAYTFFVVVGMAGGILLLGFLSIAALFAQLIIAVAFVASSFAILGAIMPITQQLVERWLKLLGKGLVGKLVYALLLMITLNTSLALMSIGGEEGFMLVFFMQSLLFVGVFLKRKEILEKVTSSKVAKHYGESENHATAFVAGAAATSLAVLTDGASSFAQTMRQGWSGSGSNTSEDAPSTSATTSSEVPAPSVASSAPQPTSRSQAAAAPGPSAGDETIDVDQDPAPQESQPEQETAVLRPLSEDLDRAQKRRREQEVVVDADVAPEEDDTEDEEPRLVASSRVATNSNFRDHLAQRTNEAKTADGVDCENFDFDDLDLSYYER